MIEPTEVTKIFKKADIIISRAGANTVSEIMIVKKPAILIPLPFAYLDEQMENAKYAEKFGVASIFDQDKGSSSDLLRRIYKIRKDWKNIVRVIYGKESPDIDAAENMYQLIRKEIGWKKGYLKNLFSGR